MLLCAKHKVVDSEEKVDQKEWMASIFDDCLIWYLAGYSGIYPESARIIGQTLKFSIRLLPDIQPI